MEAVQQRQAVLGRGLALLAAYAVIIGALSVVINAGPALDGEVPAIIRVLLGLGGMVAGGMLWTGYWAGIDGWMAVMAWSLLQIPVYAWNIDGSPFVQTLEFPISSESTTTVNGEVTSLSEVGINLVGVFLTIWVVRLRERWARVGVTTVTPEVGASTFDIEHRAPDGASHLLGSVPDVELAQNAAAGQVVRLRGVGTQGEVVVIGRPGDRIVTREHL